MNFLLLPRIRWRKKQAANYAWIENKYTSFEQRCDGGGVPEICKTKHRSGRRMTLEAGEATKEGPNIFGRVSKK